MPNKALWLAGVCLFACTAALLAAYPPQSAAAQAPVSAEVAARALDEALLYATVTYDVDGRTTQGVAYLWGGRMTLDEYLRAVSAGKKPGVEAGVDASALVVNAYRAADPGRRFRYVSGGEERWSTDATSAVIYEWNTEFVPYTSLRPGDLIFFQDEQGRVTGVALFERLEGPNVHFVVASAGSGKVIRTFLNVNNNYWKTRVKGTGRLLEASR